MRRLLSLAIYLCLSFPHSSNSMLLPLGYPCAGMGDAATNVTHCLQPDPDCSSAAASRYRSPDGTCNNLRNATWGAAGARFTRAAEKRQLTVIGYPPVFYARDSDDSKSLSFPRLSRLPSARAVSTAVHSGADDPPSELRGEKRTLLVMQVGQLVDHDLTLTPEMSTCSESCPREEEVDCCRIINNSTAAYPKFCLPIEVPPDDEVFGARGCIDFKRSQQLRTCDRFPVYEQINAITSFLDASMVYGSDEERAAELRTGRDGMLKEGDMLLPLEEDECEEEEKDPAFMAGDDRVNENPGLQSMHTLWMKEHNRLARALKAENPSLGDEELYQEAKRYLTAEWQQVVMAEFLPVVLGPALVRKMGLSTDGPSIYREAVRPDISTEFATAAFRFGHSLISKDILLMSNDFATSTVMTLKDNFFKTDTLRAGRMADLLRGMCMQKAEAANNVLSSALRNFLFVDPEHPMRGSDLAARNVQRGRDHALATYGDYRKECGLTMLPQTYFGKAPKELSREAWTRLRRAYPRSPWEVELFPGGMSETPVEGGLVGPTFACIIGRQFRALKDGDRYFFTHRNVHRNIRFCPPDLQSIRRRRLFDVLCDNSDVDRAPRDPFTEASEQNPLVKCQGNTRRLDPVFKCVDDASPGDAHPPFQSGGSSSPSPSSSSSGHVVVLAGGTNPFRYLSSVEVYSPSGGCNRLLAPLPFSTSEPILFFSAGMLLACGGRHEFGNGGKQCLKYVPDGAKGRWERDAELDMKEVRDEAAYAKTESGRVYVSGGRPSPRSVEYFDPRLRRWVRGPDMDVDKTHHCMVATVGGMMVMGGERSREVGRVDLLTGSWQHRSDLFTYRRRCILLPDKETVLTYAGPRFCGLYHWPTGRNALTDDTILARDWSKAVNVDGRILFFGGTSYSTRVEEYDPSIGRFRLLDGRRLLVGRANFGAASVPASFFAHLPGGCSA